MNKKLLLFAASLLSVLPYAILCENKQLVQTEIDKLHSTLASKPLKYEERMRVLSNLRRRFNRRKMRPYKSKNEEDIVKLVSRSYEDIKHTAGQHTRALDHYKDQAAGAIALYTKPSKLKKAPTGSEAGTPPSMATRASDALGSLLKTSPAGTGGQLSTQTAPATKTTATKAASTKKATQAKGKSATKKKKSFEDRVAKKKRKKDRKKAERRQAVKKGVSTKAKKHKLLPK